jgi:hypothetical protein
MSRRPFEVDVDCGSAIPVRFTLDEESLRNSRNFKIKAALHDNTGDPDDQTRLWRAALTAARSVVERNLGKSGAHPQPIEIYDGQDVWLIPEASVRWVRLHDPESPDRQRGEMGFRVYGESQ